MGPLTEMVCCFECKAARLGGELCNRNKPIVMRQQLKYLILAASFLAWLPVRAQSLDFDYIVLVDPTCVSVLDNFHVYMESNAANFEDHEWTTSEPNQFKLISYGRGAYMAWDYSATGNLSSASVTLEAESGGNPSSVTESISTNFHFSPVVEFSPGGTVSGCAPFTLDLTNRSHSLYTGESLSYEWDFGDGSTSGETSPSHTWELEGEYIVRLIATDSQSCSSGGEAAAKTLRITVLGEGECE